MHNYFIYMASGNSTRYGENKLLVNINGKPLYLYGLEILKEVVSVRKNCSVIVVSRYRDIRETAKNMNFMTVDCPESINGISYTVKAGIKSIKNIECDDKLIFVVADQPYMNSKSLFKLIDAVDRDTLTARIYYDFQPGNPVLFSAELIPELLSLDGDNGGGKIAEKYNCIKVFADRKEEIKDIDRKEDL